MMEICVLIENILKCFCCSFENDEKISDRNIYANTTSYRILRDS